MKLVRPVTVLDAVLTSTNVVETPPAVYAGGTTYALGSTVSVLTGTSVSVYTSLQSGNLGHTPASSPTWWALTGATYSLWSAGQAYSLNDIVIVVGANSHLSYQRLVAGTTATVPSSDSANWLPLGATNAWAMFDASVTSQTSNPGSITQTFTVPGRCDSVACLNTVCDTIRVQMTDPVTAGVVYDVTYKMISDNGINDPYAYSFEPIERLSDLVVTGLPPYANAIITVTMSIGTGNALCGALILGLSRDVGSTQYGASVGITDYSTKTQDVFGNYQITKRAFSKRADFTVWVPGSLVDKLELILAGYRATPILYVGSDGYTSTAVYGFFKDFAVTISYPTVSVCTISVEGLT